jgi:hypothetical protein
MSLIVFVLLLVLVLGFFQIMPHLKMADALIPGTPSGAAKTRGEYPAAKQKDRYNEYDRNY